MYIRIATTVVPIMFQNKQNYTGEETRDNIVARVEDVMSEDKKSHGGPYRTGGKLRKTNRRKTKRRKSNNRKKSKKIKHRTRRR